MADRRRSGGTESDDDWHNSTRREEETSPALLTQTVFRRKGQSSRSVEGPETVQELHTRRVEDQHVRFRSECLGDLPKGIVLSEVIQQAVEDLAFCAAQKIRWLRLLKCEKSLCVIHDVFWFTLCNSFDLNCFRTSRGLEETKKNFFKRISRNYVLLLFTLDERRKKTFASKFYLCLVEIVLLCFKTAYPLSKHKFDSRFEEQVRSTLSQWILGVTNAKAVRTSTLGLLLANSPNKGKSSTQSTAPRKPPHGKQTKQVDLGFHVSRKGVNDNAAISCSINSLGTSHRKSYSLLYSPLMASFLEQQRVGTIGSRKWKLNVVVTECQGQPIFCTNGEKPLTSPPEKGRGSATKVQSKTFLDMVQGSERRRKEWFQNHERLTSEASIV